VDHSQEELAVPEVWRVADRNFNHGPWARKHGLTWYLDTSDELAIDLIQMLRLAEQLGGHSESALSSGGRRQTWDILRRRASSSPSSHSGTSHSDARRENDPCFATWSTTDACSSCKTGSCQFSILAGNDFAAATDEQGRCRALIPPAFKLGHRRLVHGHGHLRMEGDSLLTLTYALAPSSSNFV
jgi:hypothetical protein